MAAPTLPTRPHTETRYLEPAGGRETIGCRCIMASAWQHGGHVHITLAHGLYGVGCSVACGTREWRP